MNDRDLCSKQNPELPMAGSADVVDVWVLLEYPGVFKAKAVEESTLDPAVKHWLHENLEKLHEEGYHARLQLIKRDMPAESGVRLYLGALGELREFSGPDYGFLEELELVEAVNWPSAGTVVEETQYFVCTNGQRDVCCARFGLPVYEQLRALVGARAWQVNHLGGHRFAPNVLVLPDGILYGRVQLEDLPAFVETVERGHLSFPHLRGRTAYSKLVQAAEALRGEDHLSFVEVHGDDKEAVVTFLQGSHKTKVKVRQIDWEEPVLLSCKDAAPKPVHSYELV